MTARLPKPNLRRGRATPHFVQRVPQALRERVDGMAVFVPIGEDRIRVVLSKHRPAVRVSLRTTVKHEATVRQAEVAAFFATLWASLREVEPIRLTQRQCVALAGEAFRHWQDSSRAKSLEAEWSAPLSRSSTHWFVDDPFEVPEEWQAAIERVEAFGTDPEDLEPHLGPLIDHALRDRGIATVDRQTRAVLLRETSRALKEAFKAREAEASGDFRTPEVAGRFPEWQAPAEAPKPKAGAVSLSGLVDRWWVEAKSAGRALSTFESYRATVQRFVAFLEHDDAAGMTQADVLRFKDHRVAQGISLKTVKDSDLAGLRAIFAYGVGNGLLTANPADGIKVLRPKKARTRAKGFTAEEAVAILSKAVAHVPAANEKPQMTAAKRWVPWLCAYTGARIGELVQLRKEDVRQVDGFWTITITPEAGTVKDKDARTVVLHPHLIEKGFPAFAGGSKHGPLFLTAKAGSSFEELRGKWRAAKNRLAEFAREVVPDDRVSPNHGWRHLFKTKGREVGIADSVLDAIGGWEPDTVGGDYGDVSLQAQAAAFERFPRFDV